MTGHGKKYHLGTKVLRFLDRFGQVVIAADQVHDVGDAIACLRDEVQSMLQIDALLFAVHRCSSEAELDTRQGGYPALLWTGDASCARVVPMDS